ncbi:MAG: hypothetical protein HKN67_11730 [Saprospiraceae bacterium]|nr:hypothetical protein [Saprospiraceae bacterium]
MMKRLILLFAIFTIFACERYYISDFCEALIHEDVSYVRHEVDNILYDLLPQATHDDPLGHYYNLMIFVDELNRDDCMYASIICYGCIESFPLQSEVLVEIDDGQYITEKVLDIATPPDSEMYFVGLHN